MLAQADAISVVAGSKIFITEVSNQNPREYESTGQFGPFPNEDGQIGWPVEFELADGAALLFPWLEKD